MEVFCFNNIFYNSFIYKWVNKDNGKYYIGSHKGSIDDGYSGSGIDFKKEYSKNRDIFEREIIEFLLVDEYKDIREKEEYYLKLYNVEYDENSYNRTNTSYGGYHEKSMLLRKNTIDSNGRNLFQVYSDKIVKTRKKNGSYKTSKIKEYETKNKTGTIKKIKEKISLANKDRISIYDNDNNEKKVYESELENYLKEGWKIGHPPNRKYKKVSERKGKRLIIKNSEFKTINNDELSEYLENGWIIFSTTKGNRLMNNGIIQKSISKEKIEEYLNNGWKFGRIKI